jgi:3-oxoacyl-[acyl-carrier protein] reductase
LSSAEDNPKPAPRPGTAQGGPLAGRVAIVTGASRGIGRGIAEGLAADGAAVVVNYRRDEDAAAEVVAGIEASGGRAVAVAASVAEQDGVERIAAVALETFGHVDAIVANAGVASRGLAIAETERRELERLTATHVFSAHQLCALLLPQMRERERGDVVVISSSELVHMRPLGAPYNMAKAALEAFALTLAKEEARNGIRANIVAPGLVPTDMGDRLVRAKLGIDSAAALDAEQPFGRVTRPTDVAAAVAYLLVAEQMTGQRLVVDGGADASPTG